jgi:hypothetical protein
MYGGRGCFEQEHVGGRAVTSVQLNPQGIEEEYLRCLNLCFGNWGDRRSYHWYFRRATAYPQTDLIVLREEERLVAGSAVSYRRVAFPDGSAASVGIMTGSWTLPEFRGRGYFTRIIEESLRLTSNAGGGALLAFVTEENSSFRQLMKAGAALIPSSYLFSTPTTQGRAGAGRLQQVEKSERVISEIFERLNDDRARRFCRFLYSSENDFRSQFIARPGEIEIYRDDAGSIGIVERKGETDLLQLCLTDVDDEAALTNCLAGFLSLALERRRKFFLYSMLPALARTGERLGLGIKRGFLTILPTGEGETHPWANHPWSVQGGDRL